MKKNNANECMQMNVFRFNVQIVFTFMRNDQIVWWSIEVKLTTGTDSHTSQTIQQSNSQTVYQASYNKKQKTKTKNQTRNVLLSIIKKEAKKYVGNPTKGIKVS